MYTEVALSIPTETAHLILSQVAFPIILEAALLTPSEVVPTQTGKNNKENRGRSSNSYRVGSSNFYRGPGFFLTPSEGLEEDIDLTMGRRLKFFKKNWSAALRRQNNVISRGVRWKFVKNPPKPSSKILSRVLYSTEIKIILQRLLSESINRVSKIPILIIFEKML